ncbi:hypothetical protein FQN57_007532 [Myotisia sp. PD_48]|nr:hypothetical protein FQN57_007532 [Myotisia sp. PD_48]
MAITGTKFKLNTGAEIPAIGLGTWRSVPGEAQNAVKYAIEFGYRHIDTARAYGNEADVGEGLAQAFKTGQVKREEVFITAKLWSTFHTRVAEGLEESLRNLGLEYIDLFLMHWPVATNDKGNHPMFPTHPDGSRDILTGSSHIETYKDMEKLLDTGKVKAIGVCNYSLKYLKELIQQCSIIPAVNQIENHPLLPQEEIVEFCKETGILVTAYSPFGSDGGPLLNQNAILQVAMKRGVSTATILLSWHTARGSCVLSKSIIPSRIESNYHLVDLDESEMEAIASFTKKHVAEHGFQRYVYPPWGIDFGFPDKSP